MRRLHKSYELLDPATEASAIDHPVDETDETDEAGAPQIFPSITGTRL